MESRKINIARIWSKYEGQYESRAGVIMGLDPQRYRTICIYLAKNSKKSNFLEAKGYKTIYISENQSLQRFNFMLVWKLAKIIKTEKIDIIHCHKHKSTVYGIIAAMIARTPVVIAHVHGLDRTRNWQRRFKNFFLMKKVCKILTVGEAVKNDVLKNNTSLPPEKVYSLGNSIDYMHFADVAISKEDAKRILGIPSDAFIFGMIARFGTYKGHNFLVSAFEKVKNEIPSAHLILAGDGPLRKKIQKQAAKASLDDSVHFLGLRDDIPHLLRAMDAFVLPSIGSEGMPRVILEAMAAGVPCIGTNVGGIPEILANEDYGKLVPPKDENSLADAMVELATKPNEDVRHLVEKARQRVKNHYTHDVIIKKLEKLYETCTMRN